MNGGRWPETKVCAGQQDDRWLSWAGTGINLAVS